MKKIELILATMLLLVTACTSEDMDKDRDNTTNKELITFESVAIPATRTTMDHSQGAGASAFWTTGDNIWVDNGATRITNTSSNISGKMPLAAFYFAGNTLTANSYPVYYTGKASTKGDEVTIKTAQTQSAPGDASHIGESGDCGTATANRNAHGIYKFSLDHKAAYICFYPRCENAALGANIYLTKIVVTSDNVIAGTYDFTGGTLTGATPTSGSSNTITLTTGATSFPLNTTTTSDTHSAYMVIAPGTHTLTIDYWIKDPVTHVEGAITKKLSAITFAENTVTDLTANIAPTDYSKRRYWEWDAKKHYWDGYESSQPMMNGLSSTDYPKSNATPLDERSYTVWDWNNPIWPGGASMSGPAASNTAVTCPSTYEAAWYVAHGNAHWDNETLWQFGNHLYMGGVWFKKKASITGFSDTTYPSSVSGYWPEISHPTKTGKPNDAETDYFYLPALGQYGTMYDGHSSEYIPAGNGYNTGSAIWYSAMGNLSDLGIVGYYWLNRAVSFTALYDNPVYFLSLKNGEVKLECTFYGNAALGRNYWTAE